MSDVRVALIGAGNIGATHARAIAGIAGARLAAVYGPTAGHARDLAAPSGANVYDDLDTMFSREPLDMVAVATPSGLHGAHGAAAARRGIHVLVEKPIEITTARADALIGEARRAGVTLGVIFQDRFKPDVCELKALLDRGALGTLLLARAQVPWWRAPEYYRESRWRGTWALDGGGVLMNQAIHTVDQLLWLCGPVARVFGRTTTECHDIEVEDTAVATLEFASGALGTLEATTCAYPGRARRIEITGSQGWAALDGDRLQRDSPANGPPPQNVASPVVTDASAHRDAFVDFIHAFQHGTRPRCDGGDARRSVAVIEAIYESSRRLTPVEVKGDSPS